MTCKVLSCIDFIFFLGVNCRLGGTKLTFKANTVLCALLGIYYYSHNNLSMPSLYEEMLAKNKYFVNSMSLQFLRSTGQGLKYY